MNRQLFPTGRPEWLRTIPEDWDARPIFSLFQRRVQRGHADLEPLSVYRDYGVVIREERDDNYNRLGSNLDSYLRVKPGDLVLNKMKTWQGSLGISQYEGIVSPAYIVCRPIHDQSPRYLHYLLRSPPYVHQYARLSYGVRVNQWDMRFDDFRTLPCLIPPLETQQTIASFLDRETAKIDTLIEKKQRLLELLEEKRTALITQAVTRGLDPDVPTKDSGVEWIGEIPEHWEVLPLKFVMRRVVDCLHSTPQYVDNGAYPAIRTADVNSGDLNLANARRVDEEQYRIRIQRLRPQAGDILYSREGERYGHAALVPEGVRLCLSQRMMHFRAARRHSPRFLMWGLNSRGTYAQAALDTAGATAPHVNVETIRNFQLAVPPREEQEDIESYLGREVERLSKVRERVLGAISLLEEYRTSLISAAATGHVNV